MRRIILVVVVITISCLSISCGVNPYAETNREHKKQAKAYMKQLRTFPPEHLEGELPIRYGPHWVGTTNFNLRKPNFVIIHHTAQESAEQTLKTFTLKRTSVSAHYVIGKNGEVYQMLNDYYRGWHAGAGKWGNTTDLNSSSIGIELDNNGFEPFAEEQMISLLHLLAVLKERHGIPTANFIGHSDIAPSRKVDPNVTFPWRRLAQAGYGHWYDEIKVEPKVVGDSIASKNQDNSGDRILPLTGDELHENGSAQDSLFLNPEIALRIIGYDVSDLDAAIKAFKLHFIQKDIDAVLTEEDLKILYNLYRKYL